MTKEKKPRKKSASNKKLYAEIKKEEILPKQKPSMGRPTLYNEELADVICSRIVNGEGVVRICRDADMPSVQSIYTWLRLYPNFLDRYTTAREDQAETLADEITDIADNATNDWMERSDDKSAGFILNGEHIQRSKLRIETRKWIASKLKPKKYGDFNRTELTGKDGEPIKTIVSQEEIRKMADEIRGEKGDIK